MRDPGQERAQRGNLLALVQGVALPLDFRFCSASIAKVTQICGEHALSGKPKLDDRQLDRKNGAIAPQRLDLDPSANHPTLARSDQAGEAGRVRVPQLRRDDHLPQRTPDHICPPMAEDALGSRIELAQRSGLVHQDHAIQRRVDDRPAHRIGDGDTRFLASARLVHVTIRGPPSRARTCSRCRAPFSEVADAPDRPRSCAAAARHGRRCCARTERRPVPA